MLLVFGRDTNAGVSHGKTQRHHLVVLAHHADFGHHLTLGGELHRIAAQVQQHLMQPQHVTCECLRCGGVDVKQHLDRFAADIRRHNH